MKTKLIILSLFAALTGVSEEIDYRATLRHAHARLSLLETERRAANASRRAELPSEMEKDRLQLIGQLTEIDPLWVLSRSLEADIMAIAVASGRSEADTQTLDQLKDLLAILAGVIDIPASRDQAVKFSAALRGFMVRRDVAGAIAWAKQLPK